VQNRSSQTWAVTSASFPLAKQEVLQDPSFNTEFPVAAAARQDTHTLLH